MQSFAEMEAGIRAWSARWPLPQLARRLAFWVGFVGFLGLMAMFLLSVARGRWLDWRSAIGWGVSALLFAGGIALDLPGFLLGILEYTSPRRAVYGLNVLVMVSAAFAILVFANYFAARHYARKDVTAEGTFTLDARTLNWLAKLDDKAAADGAEIEAYFILAGRFQFYDRLEKLLDEYKARSKHFHYQVFTPMDRQLVEGLQLRLKLDTVEANSLIISYGERFKTLKQYDLVEEMPYMPYMGGRRPEPKFKAEDAISSALRDLVEERKSVVCVITGHGERDVSHGAGSLSYLADELKGLNIEVREWNLPKERHVPPDANVLVIADPRMPPFKPEEAELLSQFLAGTQGGIVLFVEPYVQTKDRVPAGLDDWLASYGFKVHADKVVVQRQRVLMIGGSREQVSPAVGADSWGYHEIVGAFRDNQVVADFVVACPIELVDPKNKDYKTEKLAWANGVWGEKSVDKRPQYDAGEDLDGPITLAAIAEPKSKDDKVGKLLVIGDVDLVANPQDANMLAFKQIGYNLVINGISYMLGKRENIGIEERQVVERQVSLGPTGRRVVFYVSVVGIPVLIAMVGAMVLLLRRF